jgi:hypothetical protein
MAENDCLPSPVMVYRTYSEVASLRPDRYMYRADRVYKVLGNIATDIKNRAGHISSWEISPENVALLIKLIRED